MVGSLNVPIVQNALIHHYSLYSTYSSPVATLREQVYPAGSFGLRLTPIYLCSPELVLLVTTSRAWHPAHDLQIAQVQRFQLLG